MMGALFVSMQPRKKTRDVKEENGRDQDSEELVVPFARRGDRDCGRDQIDNVESEIRPAWQAMVEHPIAINAGEGEGDEQTEKSFPLPEIMCAHIDRIFPGEFRKEQARAEVKQDGLREKGDKLIELPIVPIAQIEHGPPGLGADQQEGGGPELGYPITLHPVLIEHALAQPLQDLGHRQADDDGEQDREVAELIHAARKGLAVVGALGDGELAGQAPCRPLFKTEDGRDGTLLEFAPSLDANGRAPHDHRAGAAPWRGHR